MSDHPIIEIPDPDDLTMDKLSVRDEDEISIGTVPFGTVRWIEALKEALVNYPKSTVIQIATVDSSTRSHLPKSRCHIFRKLIEPDTKPFLPLLLSTTDIRTPKVDQMIHNPNIEVSWWIEGERKQWRLNGTVSIIPTPTHPLYKNFHAVWDAHRDPITSLDVLRTESFDWESQRMEIFKSLSSEMRASFCRPIPGSNLSENPINWPTNVDDPEHYKGEENKYNWDMALANFALVVCDPIEVDYLDMSVAPNRRWRQWITETKWTEQEVVP